MRRITIQYHYEPDGWWADSPDIPGYTAAGATFEDVRKQALDGVEFFEEGEFVIHEIGAVTFVSSTSGDYEKAPELKITA